MAKKVYIVGPTMYDRAALYINNQLLTLHHRDQAGNHISLSAPAFEFIPSKWYHVAGSFSKQNGMSLYIDGKLVAYDVNKTTSPASFACLKTIGASGLKGRHSITKGNFPGWIDDINLYSKELGLYCVQRLSQRKNKKIIKNTDTKHIPAK